MVEEATVAEDGHQGQAGTVADFQAEAVEASEVVLVGAFPEAVGVSAEEAAVDRGKRFRNCHYRLGI